MKVLHSYFAAVVLLCAIGSSPGAKAQTSTRAAAGRTVGSPASQVSKASAAIAKKRVVFFGNSLTAGYGVAPKNNLPSLIAQKIDSAGLNYQVVNAGVSGETTAGGLSRVGSVLRQPVDVFVLELGANDVFRLVPTATIRRNLQGIIDAMRKKNPRAQIVIAGMQIPGLFGEGYITEFQGLFREVATKNQATLIPYLLENVGGVPELNQPDGIHPTAAGYRIVARSVWNKLVPLLESQASIAQ